MSARRIPVPHKARRCHSAPPCRARSPRSRHGPAPGPAKGRGNRSRAWCPLRWRTVCASPSTIATRSGRSRTPAGKPVGGLGNHVIGRLQTRGDQRHAGLVDMAHAGIDDGDLGPPRAGCADRLASALPAAPAPMMTTLGVGLHRRPADSGLGIAGRQGGKRATSGGHRQKGAARAVEVLRHFLFLPMECFRGGLINIANFPTLIWINPPDAGSVPERFAASPPGAARIRAVWP